MSASRSSSPQTPKVDRPNFFMQLPKERQGNTQQIQKIHFELHKKYPNINYSNMYGDIFEINTTWEPRWPTTVIPDGTDINDILILLDNSAMYSDTPSKYMLKRPGRIHAVPNKHVEGLHQRGIYLDTNFYIGIVHKGTLAYLYWQEFIDTYNAYIETITRQM